MKLVVSVNISQIITSCIALYIGVCGGAASEAVCLFSLPSILHQIRAAFKRFAIRKEALKEFSRNCSRETEIDKPAPDDYNAG